MIEPSYIYGLVGGLIIGLSGAIYLLGNGRIMGASGVIGGLIDGSGRGEWRDRALWRRVVKRARALYRRDFGREPRLPLD